MSGVKFSTSSVGFGADVPRDDIRSMEGSSNKAWRSAMATEWRGKIDQLGKEIIANVRKSLTKPVQLMCRHGMECGLQSKITICVDKAR